MPRTGHACARLLPPAAARWAPVAAGHRPPRPLSGGALAGARTSQCAAVAAAARTTAAWMSCRPPPQTRGPRSLPGRGGRAEAAAQVRGRNGAGAVCAGAVVKQRPHCKPGTAGRMRGDAAWPGTAKGGQPAGRGASRTAAVHPPYLLPHAPPRPQPSPSPTPQPPPVWLRWGRMQRGGSDRAAVAGARVPSAAMDSGTCTKHVHSLHPSALKQPHAVSPPAPRPPNPMGPPAMMEVFAQHGKGAGYVGKTQGVRLACKRGCLHQAH
jgi:hypothetical protein